MLRIEVDLATIVLYPCLAFDYGGIVPHLYGHEQGILRDAVTKTEGSAKIIFSPEWISVDSNPLHQHGNRHRSVVSVDGMWKQQDSTERQRQTTFHNSTSRAKIRFGKDPDLDKFARVDRDR